MTSSFSVLTTQTTCNLAEGSYTECHETCPSGYDFKCSTIDYEDGGGKQCAKGKFTCSAPNTSSCPTLGTYTAEMAFFSDPSKQVPGQSITASCLYPTVLNYSGILNNYQVFQDYYTKVVQPNQNGTGGAFVDEGGYKLLGQNFCNSPASSSLGNCPNGVDGKQMEGCSRFVVSGPEGALCRQWCSDNPDVCDSTKSAYCQTHNTDDCTCLNRSSNDVYKGIYPSQQPQGSDVCWFTPCQNSSEYVVTSNLNPSNFNCTGVCQAASAAAAKSSIPQSQYAPYVSCSTAPNTCTGNPNVCSSSQICVNGQCVTKGATCTSNAQCVPPNYCDSGTGVCLPINNKPCYTNTDCNASGYACGTNGKCSPTCTSNADCASGLTCQGTGSNMTCQVDNGGGGGSTTTWWSKYKWWIIGGAIAFVVLLIILWLALSPKKPKTV